jgi:hypothetical protein
METVETVLLIAVALLVIGAFAAGSLYLPVAVILRRRASWRRVGVDSVAADRERVAWITRLIGQLVGLVLFVVAVVSVIAAAIYAGAYVAGMGWVAGARP